MIYGKDRHIYEGPGIYVGRAMPAYGLKESVLRNRSDGKNRLERIANYKIWLWKEMQLGERVYLELKRIAMMASHGDVILTCWCLPRPCHIGVIISAVEFLHSPAGQLWEQEMLSRLNKPRPHFPELAYLNPEKRTFDSEEQLEDESVMGFYTDDDDWMDKADEPGACVACATPTRWRLGVSFSVKEVSLPSGIAVRRDTPVYCCSDDCVRVVRGPHRLPGRRRQSR